MLAHLESVDHVALFDQPTPYELIRLVQPDVLVKGGDWPVERIVGRDVVQARGGQVHSLPLLPGHSTTEFLRRVRAAAPPDMLARRTAEAQALAAVYQTLLPRLGEGGALDAVRVALDALAADAGRAFAAQAPHGPGLEHFATILDLWRGSGVLDVEDVVLVGDTLTFRVTRCGYVQAYRSMGLPEVLVGELSCRRDAPFARGYHHGLRLERPETIAAGHDACGFRFTWSEEA